MISEIGPPWTPTEPINNKRKGTLKKIDFSICFKVYLVPPFITQAIT